MKKQQAKRVAAPATVTPSRSQKDGRPHSVDSLLRLTAARRYLLALHMDVFSSVEDEQFFLNATPEEQCTRLLYALNAAPPPPPPDVVATLRRRVRELEGQVAALIDTVHALVMKR